MPSDIDSLAYLTAKTHGLNDLADEILEANGLTSADIDDVPSFDISDLMPPPLLPLRILTGRQYHWVKTSSTVPGKLERSSEVPYTNIIEATGVAASSALDAWAREEEVHDIIDPEEGGWELDVGEGAPIAVDDVAVVADDMGAGATSGVSESDLWIRNSPFAGDHVAAGSFDTAMQVGLVHKKT
jgi:coatomer subunit alpha